MGKKMAAHMVTNVAGTDNVFSAFKVIYEAKLQFSLLKLQKKHVKV